MVRRLAKMAAAARTDPYDVPLSLFLVGRYARESLRSTLDGIFVSDLADLSLADFLEGIEKKDYHIARVFWFKVLTPVWEAWCAWDRLRAERVVVDTARRAIEDVLAVAQGNGAANGAAPNNR